MSNSLETLDKTFNTETTNLPEILTSSIPMIPTVSDKNNKLEDSDEIRTQLSQTLNKAQSALDCILQEQQINVTARNTEATAKLVEAVAKLISLLTDLNIKEKEFKFKQKEDNEEETPQINNTLILTSEEVFAKLLKK